MKRWRRALTVAGRMTPFVLAFLRDRRRWILFGGRRRLPFDVHQRRATRLTQTIGSLGPTFIKLAQVFSARADILPEPYLSAIGTLQDQVPSVPADAIEEVIRAELGASVAELFEHFDPTPIAAASLGQVHRARLAPPSEEQAPPEPRDVVVKVLRPGVEELVALDLDISFRVLLVLNILFPNHHVKALTNVVREFSVRVRAEMDFRQESANVALFHRHFAEDSRVRAPIVVERFTRQRVLVMEWVAGDKIDRLSDRFATGELSFTTIMETLTEVYLRMLLVEGFLHADPHPGNILIAPDGTIVFLDWGMVVQLPSGTRERILNLALAAGRDDLDAMVNGMYALGMIDPDISRADIRDAGAEILAIVDRTKDLGPRRVQEMIQDIMDTFYTWPLQLPRELVYFLRAAALLEGIGFRYEPNFNGLEIFRPVVERMRGDLLRTTMREPREVARGLAEEVRSELFALRDVLRRAEREEFRIRLHPRDILQGERFLLLQVRRLLLSIFALTIAIITTLTFLAIRNVWLFALGLFIALVMFVIVFLLPSHLLENPLRHARSLRRRDF
jgi:predicted unusual protein kinase regulating ubiquinone biosynthesis (AarF/ABC1/UbiB family)